MHEYEDENINGTKKHMSESWILCHKDLLHD